MTQNADRTLAMLAMQNLNAHQDSGLAVKTPLGSTRLLATLPSKTFEVGAVGYLNVSSLTVIACKQKTECECTFAGRLACHHRELYTGHGPVSCTHVYVVLWSRTMANAQGASFFMTS